MPVPYSFAPEIKRPSEQLEDLRLGRTSWDASPDAIRSWAMFHVHQAALQILDAPDKGTRRNMLGRVPAHMRGFVEAEAKRVWALRQP
jgi:hypothetical protein